MGIFDKFEQPTRQETLINRAERGIDILAGDLESRNWTEIWDDLCHTELNSPEILAKMSAESQEKFENLISEVKEVFAEEKESIAEDLVMEIQEALNKFSESN